MERYPKDIGKADDRLFLDTLLAASTPNLKDRNGDTVLHLVARNCKDKYYPDPEGAEIFMGNTRDNKPERAEYLVEAFSMLVEAGWSASEKNSRGESPLGIVEDIRRRLGGAKLGDKVCGSAVDWQMEKLAKKHSYLPDYKRQKTEISAGRRALADACATVLLRFSATADPGSAKAASGSTKAPAASGSAHAASGNAPAASVSFSATGSVPASGGAPASGNTTAASISAIASGDAPAVSGSAPSASGGATAASGNNTAATSGL